MNIFETKAEMPDENNLDVVRTAQTMPQRNRNYLHAHVVEGLGGPATMPQERSVENIQPRRRGHNY